MRHGLLLLMIATIALGSCRKEKTPTKDSTILPPQVAMPVVFLKNIEIPNLPSPYYHFEYDGNGKSSVAAYASDLRRYEVDYDKGKIGALTNTISAGLREVLKYSYDNDGRVNAIDYFDVTGTLYVKVALTYEGQRLVKLERQRLLGADFVINKIMTFSYYADGNVREIVDHRPAVAGQQPDKTTIDLFEQYDDKINVDGFSLLHNDFFDHLVLLPGVRLQINNPGKETVTGDGVNYTGFYTYTYNGDKLPLTKNGNFTITAGSDAGQTFQSNSSFSYY